MTLARANQHRFKEVPYSQIRFAIHVRNDCEHPENFGFFSTKKKILRAAETVLQAIELDILPVVAELDPELARRAYGSLDDDTIDDPDTGDGDGEEEPVSPEPPEPPPPPPPPPEPIAVWKLVSGAAVLLLLLLLPLLFWPSGDNPNNNGNTPGVEPTALTPEEIRAHAEKDAEASRAQALTRRQTLIDAAEKQKQIIDAFETKLDHLLTNEDGKRLASLDYAVSVYQALQARTRPTPADVDALLEQMPPESLYDPGNEPLYRPTPLALAELRPIEQGLTQISERLRPDQRELSKLLRAASELEPAEFDLKTTIEKHRALAEQQDANAEQALIGNTLDVNTLWKGNVAGDASRPCMWFVHSYQDGNVVFKSPTTRSTIEGVLNGRKLGLTERENTGRVVATYEAEIARGRLHGLRYIAGANTRPESFSLRYSPPDPSEVDPDVLKEATKPPHPFQPDTKWVLTIDMGRRQKQVETTLTVDQKTGPGSFWASDSDGRRYTGSVYLDRKTLGLSTQAVGSGLRSSFSGEFTDTEVTGTASLGTRSGPVKQKFVLKLEQAE